MIDPRGFETPEEWCEFMILPLSRFAIVPRPLFGWQDWALTVVQASEIASLHPPDPRAFEDWRTWAVEFMQVVPT